MNPIVTEVRRDVASTSGTSTGLWSFAFGDRWATLNRELDHWSSVAFPAWCLGHEPELQILCVSYAQDLADKLSRDCRHIVASDWYRTLFSTRLSPQRAAMPEFDTTAQGCR